MQRTLTIAGSITVLLISCLTKQVKLLLMHHKQSSPESKQDKQEVSCTVILPLKLSRSALFKKWAKPGLIFAHFRSFRMTNTAQIL